MFLIRCCLGFWSLTLGQKWRKAKWMPDHVYALFSMMKTFLPCLLPTGNYLAQIRFRKLHFVCLTDSMFILLWCIAWNWIFNKVNKLMAKLMLYLSCNNKFGHISLRLPVQLIEFVFYFHSCSEVLCTLWSHRGEPFCKGNVFLCCTLMLTIMLLYIFTLWLLGIWEHYDWCPGMSDNL